MWNYRLSRAGIAFNVGIIMLLVLENYSLKKKNRNKPVSGGLPRDNIVRKIIVVIKGILFHVCGSLVVDDCK